MTYGLFGNPAASGVYRLPAHGWAALEMAAKSHCLLWLPVSLGKAESLDDALRILGETLAFPEWYGVNLDALHECLADLGWRPAPGYVLVLSRCCTLVEHDAAGFSRLLSVIADVAALWHAQDVGFWCLFDADLPGFQRLPDAT